MDKKLYLIVELDENTQSIAMDHYEIIKKDNIIGTQTKDIPYHITLCLYSLEKEKNIIELLEKINEQFFEIEIHFSGFGLFGLNVLFFNPAMNKELLELYNFFKDKSLNKYEEFSAHMTLLLDEPENVLKVLPKMTKEFKAFTGKIISLSLYEFFPKRFIYKINSKTGKISERKNNDQKNSA